MPTEEELEVEAQLQRLKGTIARMNAEREARFWNNFDLKRWVEDNGLTIRDGEPTQPPVFDVTNYETRYD